MTTCKTDTMTNALVSIQKTVAGCARYAGVIVPVVLILSGLWPAPANIAAAQSYDLLLQGGHVIDPKNGISEPMDVGIAGGKIAEVSPDIAPGQAARVIDAGGLYVTPGLIDIHGHHYHGTEPDKYLSNSFTA